jgi:hypothetical protein
MKTKVLPGLNIQYPISQLIVDRRKTIETRTYPLPLKYVDQDIYLIETPGDTGKFKARAVAILRFSGSFLYKSKAEFYRDSNQHCVDENSDWAWNEKPKWGWKISFVKPLRKAKEVQHRRGIVFTNEVIL